MLDFELFAERTLAATSTDELGRFFIRVLEKEGFENFVSAQVSAGTLKQVTFIHFPKGYIDYYRDQQYERIDPVINLGLRTARPFIWDDALPGTMTKKQMAFMDECREFGVHSGITMPFHSPGGRLDLLSISQRQQSTVDRRRLPQLYAMCAQVWQRSMALAEDTTHEPLIDALSARELECLNWVRDGESYQGIADRLRISHRTVEFHMANVLRKLEARDKTSAVVRAIRLGLV